MQVILKVINHNEVIDSYNYSDDEFVCNGKIIEVDNKFAKLVYLIGLTSEWKDNEVKDVSNGFYVSINAGSNYNKEYFINENNNEDLLVFVSEIKRIEREGK